MRVALLILVMFLAGCAPQELVGQDLPDLPPVTGQELESLLATNGKPTVVNVWASWCHPCRSEAPLLDAAASEFSNRVDFIGVDVEDSQTAAKDFIARFGLDFPHYFDRSRSVPQFFGGVGTPVTFFFDETGALVDTHLGVIDERSLALGIDEILKG